LGPDRPSGIRVVRFGVARVRIEVVDGVTSTRVFDTNARLSSDRKNPVAEKNQGRLS
jgi:hypothetical protein